MLPRPLARAACFALCAVLAACQRRPAAPAVQGDVAARPLAPPTAAPPAWLAGAVAAAVPDGAGWAIVLVPTDGGAARTLVAGLEDVQGLAWSPDGGWLAFGARRASNWDVYRVRRDGSGLERLTDHPGYDGGPAWSPDGRALAFESARDGNLDIYRLDPPAGPALGDIAPAAEAAIGERAPATDAAMGERTPAADAVMGERAPSAVAASGEGAAAAVAAPGGNAPTDGQIASPSAPARPTAVRLTTSDAPAIEPSWAPDGRHVAFAAWRDGRYVLEAVALDDGARTVLVATDDDARQPAFAPRGDQLAWLERGRGRSTLRAAAWDGDALALGRAGLPALLPQVDGFAWAPAGTAVAAVRRDRRQVGLTLAGTRDGARIALAPLPAGAEQVAWAPQAPDPALAVRAAEPPVPARDAVPGDRPGLVALDVDAPGPRINAALAADYAALRAEVRAATGHDFLGRLSDAWRALGYKGEGSAFFSWHKTGRAFDTQMEFRPGGGTTGMVLVREDVGGRTMFRMYLRAGPQDGSVGAPLREAGWSLYARFDGGDAERDGGAVIARIPGGYYVDFTAMAARYGWQRIPAIARGGFDWRRDWAAIEYWHYERRDGLTWFEAAQQAYDDDALAAVLSPERLRERGVSGGSSGRVGIPRGWPPEG